MLGRLTPEQRVLFLRVWDRLPRHLHDITFDLHTPEWTPATFEELRDIRCEFPNVFFYLLKGFWLLLSDAV